MANKNQGAGHDAYIESEKRLFDALEKISQATRNLKNNSSKVEALEAQNSVLENGLRDLTSDYEKLNKAFQDVSEKVKSGEILGSSDDEGLKEENATLLEELKSTRQDHEALKDSFSLLKQRFAELEEAQDASGFVVPKGEAGDGNPIAEKMAEELTAERDSYREELEKLKSEYSRQIGENELLIAEAQSANDAKSRVAESLDQTIENLETILKTSGATH